jgi:hypothetical protein
MFALKQASICELFGSMPAQNARASPAQLVCRSALPRLGACAEAGAAIAMRLKPRMKPSTSRPTLRSPGDGSGALFVAGTLCFQARCAENASSTLAVLYRRPEPYQTEKLAHIPLGWIAQECFYRYVEFGRETRERGDITGDGAG